jgi:hypothetical protein
MPNMCFLIIIRIYNKIIGTTIMDLNSFLFPAPQSSYTINAAIGDILFIPRNYPLTKPLLR